ncbi:MAG: phosphomannomutase/phosphoglucomutase [Gammaproteobacteria bacterium]|nr:MAG: phosphomannomutase/phosphoglucomutase [Gammaproteobacteria bacterium]
MNQTNIPSGQFPHEIFKAYDIRGIVDKTLTTDITRKVGQAFGSEALSRGVDTVIIAHDGRLSGPALNAALAEGLQASGCNVIDIGMVTTPMLYFATYHLNTGTGIMITGSHNPPEYNGLKMVMAGETLASNRIQDLKQHIVDGNFSNGNGQLSEEDIKSAYSERILSEGRLSRELHAVVDCGNGVASEIAPELLADLGCKITPLFCETDGNFPNHHPDPSQPDTLVDLIRTIHETGADIGLAFDGDGDRLGVVTPDGKIVWPDRQLILYARDILKKTPGAHIIYDVKCSQTVETEISKAGGKAEMWKTGHSFIKARLRETGAELAGEMSGHVFFNDHWYGFDDGLYAAVRLLHILANDARNASEVFADLPDTVNTPELGLTMVEGEHYRLIDELIANAEFPDAKVSKIDGLRVDFDNGFGLVRASNTTPKLVLRFEADNETNLEAIMLRFRNLINDTRPGLDLPF